MNIISYLTTPIVQSIIPVLIETGEVIGFFPIQTRTFTGGCTIPLTETVDIRVEAIREIHPRGTREFIAVIYGSAARHTQPWADLPGFVDAKEGHFAEHQVTPTVLITRYSRGEVGEAISTGRFAKIVSTPEPVPPKDQPELSWSATVNSKVLESLSFFDFNWWLLFVRDSKLPMADLDEKFEIHCRAHPPSGTFKATVVQTPTVVTKTVFDTVRILKLVEGAPAPAKYVFLFEIRSKTLPAIYNCTFTLNVTGE